MKLEQSYSEEERSPKHYAGGYGKMDSLLLIAIKTLTTKVILTHCPEFRNKV